VNPAMELHLDILLEQELRGLPLGNPDAVRLACRRDRKRGEAESLKDNAAACKKKMQDWLHNRGIGASAGTRCKTHKTRRAKPWNNPTLKESLTGS
jgi:hypothetical protein